MKTKFNWKKDKNDLIKSVLICLSLITTGCGVSLLGATLIDLEISANSSKSQSSFIIAARAIGYAIGSISGGFLGDNIPIVWIPMGSLLLVGLSNLFLPWMRSFWTLAPWLSLSGFGLGNLEVSANVWLINIWTNKWPPMIYSTSFSYGFGTLLAPLLAQSFLIDFVPTPASPNDVILNKTSEPLQNPDEMSLHYAFETFAFICLLLDLLFIVLILTDKPIRGEKIVQISACSPGNKLPFTPKLILKILILLLSHSGAGLNMGFGLLLLSYSVQSDLKFTKSQGALLSSAYWTVYSFGRIFAFILMNFISNRSLMYVHLTLTLIAGTNLFLTYPSTIGLAFSVLLMGIGLSPFTPLVFFNVKRHLHLSGHLTSIIIVGTIIGESIYPPLIAHIAIASVNPLAFAYICIALSLSTFIFFTSFELIGCKFQSKLINSSQVEDEIDEKQSKSLIVQLT